ncbi:MAG: glycosyltransferase family 2 protein [Motiliproteus sp.]
MNQAGKKLSVCIICMNEAKTIERCLQSVAFADEIVILDSGSTDATLEIARQYTDKIYSRKDWEGFGIQRQRAEQLASHDWIFAIDCDEVVSSLLKDEIRARLDQAKDGDVIRVNRLTNFCGHLIRHSGWYPDYVDRIYNRNQYGYNDKIVHESVNCKAARKITLKQDLLHYQFDDLFLYINKRNRYAESGANEKLKNHKSASLSRAVTASLTAFIKHYLLKRGFLDGRIGFVIAVIQMQYTFNKYLFLTYKNTPSAATKDGVDPQPHSTRTTP